MIRLAGWRRASRITPEKNLAEGYRAQFQLNVAGTQNLLKALPADSLRHVAFASSMTVYGPGRTPFVDESHPLAPNCLYALTKVAAERALTEYSRKTGVPIAILRYTSPASLAGLPAITIPGKTHGTGTQLLAAPNQDATLLAFASQLAIENSNTSESSS